MALGELSPVAGLLLERSGADVPGCGAAVDMIELLAAIGNKKFRRLLRQQQFHWDC